VTDLRNNLSAHLKNVEAGESVLVTDHRKPVAILQGLGDRFPMEQLAALAAAGIITPPQKPLSVGQFLKLPKGESSRSLTSAICEDRDGR
jgi:prevent-host-death family protein